MSAIVPYPVQTLSYRELGTVVVVNVIVCGSVLVLFGIIRSIKRNRYFFAPLYYKVAEEKTCPLHGEPSIVPSPPKPDVPPPGKGPFSWIYPTITFRQEDMLATRGLDPVMHLRTLKLMMSILALIALPGLGILVPINAYSSQEQKYSPGKSNTTDVSGVGALSMSNIRDGSQRMWVHVCATWIFTFIACAFAYREYARYAQLRTRYNSEHKAHNYTIMVKNIPHFITSSEQLQEYFKKFFGNKIVAAHMPLPTNDLRGLLKSRETTITHLQECETLAQKDGPLKRSLYMRGGRFMFSRKQDAIIYYENQLDKLDKKIDETRKLVRYQHRDKKTHTRCVGFVTFRSISEAYLCAQSVLSTDNRSGKPVPAPDVDDIYWTHLTRLSLHASKALYLLSLFFFFVIILFWGGTTAFLNSVAKIDSLEKVKWLGWLAKMLNWNTWIGDVVQQYLPFLLVVILQSLLPDIIYGVLKLRGEITRSRLEKSALRIHFIFLVFNVFLVFTITNSTFSVWSELLDLLKKSLPDLINLMGLTLPSASTSFINYLLVYGLSSLPQQMLRIGPYISSIFRTHIAVTQCERWDASRPEYPLYGIVYANCLLIFLISITYSVIAPITVPFGILVLFIEYLIAKYKYMYVTPQRFHSGAYFWPMLYNRMVVTLLISHVTILGVFSLKLFYPGVIATFPLPFLTLLFAKHTSKRYLSLSRYLPISEFPPVFSGGVLEEGLGGSWDHLERCQGFMNAYKDPAMVDTV